MRKKVVKGGCLTVVSILFLLFLLFFQRIEKTELLETEGRNFEKAEVTKVLQDNVTENGNIVGDQTVELRLLSGELLFAGILIAALGAVMDVGMSIASTLNELKDKNADMTVKDLFCSGMNVGRDMMGTMSNTLILAFTGGSINTLVFIYAYNYQYRQIINMYSVGIELMQGLSSSMGVILTVPFTSLVAAWLLGKKQK